MTPKEILARTIWGEARGEGREGMHAIGSVILNRVSAHGWWGHDIESVCTRKWQFSCWLEGDPNRLKMLAVTDKDEQYREALAIGDQAIAGQLSDITNGATHYYDSRMHLPPRWAMYLTPVATIGHHLFFREDA